MGTTAYTVAGTYTWTCPSGVTSVIVEAWGGGGDSGVFKGNKGGAGGDYAKSTISVTPTVGYTVHVATGTGDASYFDAGAACNACSGNSPGFASFCITVGDVVFTGGTATSTGGGGGPSDLANGNNSTSSTGGAAQTGSDGSHAGGAGGNAGVAGSAPGGGGGYPSTGAIGQVILTWSSGNAFTCDPVGSLTAKGVQVNRTTGTYGATGSLRPQGLGNGSQVGSFSYSPSGGVGQVTAPHGGSPRVSGTFNVGGAKRSTSPTNSDHVKVGGSFNSVGGKAGSVASPANSNNVKVGVSFSSAGGKLGHTLVNGFGGDSGGDAGQGDGEGSGGSSGNGNDTGFPTTSSTWTPCCLLPDKTNALCCGCTSYTWDWWEITEIDQFSDGGCWGEDLNGVSYYLPVTGNCGLNNSSALRFLGPSPGEFGTGAWSPQQGNCNWMSWPYVWDIYGGGGDPFYNGHGNPPTSDMFGCCYLYPNFPPTNCEKRMGWVMGCQPASSAVYVPPFTEWTSSECTECVDGLWSDVDHLIEWGSLEDCEAENGVGNCVCAEGTEPIYFGTEQDCINWGCSDCHEVIINEHSYTPAFPPLWYLSWFGPCGCGGPTYVCTTSDHPFYGRYQPTSGLDNVDQCGGYLYRDFGALDCTGPFDCTSGGRFVLLNFIQTNVALQDAPCSENPCNIGTNVVMGCDPVCASGCNGYDFTPCHACCGTNGIYATVAPMQSMKELPYTQWSVIDPNGNMLCCPSSATSGTLPPDSGETTSVMGMADFSTPKMRFRYAQFGGEFEQVDENVWLMNYPPLKFEMRKVGSDYFVNDVKLEIICDDPLIAEGRINNKLLEVTYV